MSDSSRIAGGLGAYAQNATGERSTGRLVRDIISSAQEMLRSELRLAKAEIREETAKTVQGMRTLAIGAVAGLFALGFLLTAVMQLLASVMPQWVAATLVAVGLGAVAAVMLTSGRKQLRLPMPDRTIENVKENVAPNSMNTLT